MWLTNDIIRRILSDISNAIRDIILYKTKKEGEKMVFQLGSPLLDTCVLAVLQKEDAYGYYLTQQVKKVVDISESTLYPVLRRLQKELCLETYDKEYQGRNRRYYRLTGEGRARCLYYIREWNAFKEAIDGLIEDAENETAKESKSENEQKLLEERKIREDRENQVGAEFSEEEEIQEGQDFSEEKKVKKRQGFS